MSVASNIGHGALGLRDNLLDYLSLADQSACEKHVCVDPRLGRQVTGFTLDSGSTWVASAGQAFDGIYLDIVRVKTLSETLQRAESLADCQATAGTFWWDPLASPLGLFAWDTPGVGFDQDGVGWDPGLFVHLTGNADPRNTVVVAHYLFPVSNRAVVEPGLSRDKLLNGGFEDWTSDTDAANWTEEVSGAEGWSVSGKESVIVRKGNFSGKVHSDGLASGYAGYRQTTDPSAVVGATYWLVGAYYTSAGAGASAQLLVGNTAETQFLTLDGRSLGGASDVTLANTNGEYRRFAFAFIAPFSSLRVRVRFTGSGSGDCYFDDVHLYWIPRFNFYHPLLASDAVPRTQTGRKGVYYDGYTTGLGSLKLINGSANLEELFGRFVSSYASIVTRVAGRFPNGGNEVLFDDMRIRSNGLGTKVVVTDRDATIDLQDTRTLLQGKLPRRKHSLARTPNMDPNMDGHPRVLVFGRITGAPMVRIDKNATSGYGIYELADVTDAPNGLVNVLGNYAFWSYVDEDSALRRDVNRRKKLITEDDVLLPDIRVTASTGLAEILTDVRVIEITEANNKIDFNIGAGALVASITPGLYLWGAGAGSSTDTGILKAIRDAMNTAAGVSNITAQYGSATAYKITIARGSGVTFQLLCQTGANKQASLFKTLGFDLGADRTGSLTYTGDNVVFTAPDTDHAFLRADYPGFRDDALGTYTGSANDFIELAPDVLRLILTRMLPSSVADIDDASFNAVRVDAPKKLAVFLGVFANGRKADSAETIETIIGRICTSVTADFVIHGLTMYFDVRTDDVPANIIDLYERDYHGWRSWLSAEDVYSTVRVAYNRDPALGTWQTIERTENLPTLLYGTLRDRTFETYLATPPTALLAKLSAIASKQKRHAAFGVKGRLVDQRLGAKLRLNRSRGLVDYDTGVFGAPEVRILTKDDDDDSARSEIEVVELEDS